MNEAYERFMEGQALLSRRRTPHAAVVALERARDLEPEQGSIRETLARAYFRTGRFADAEAEFAKAVELDPVNDYAHFGIGLCAMRTGRPDRARGPPASSRPSCAPTRSATATRSRTSSTVTE